MRRMLVSVAVAICAVMPAPANAQLWTLETPQGPVIAIPRTQLFRAWSATPTGIALRRLEQLQNGNMWGRDEWAKQLKAVIDIGPNAVPELIVELDRTSAADRGMLRSLPYVLRGIGDRRAIPALIRAIPKCLSQPEDDPAYSTADLALAGVLSNNDHAGPSMINALSRSHSYRYGRPIREICETLELWTQQEHGWESISAVSATTPTRQELWRKQKLFYDCAARWAEWWERDWQRFVPDAAYSRVELSPFTPTVDPELTLDPGATLSVAHGWRIAVLEPYTRPGATAVFYDLDTNRLCGVPKRWSGQTSKQLAEAEDDLVKWAIGEGFDLMGVARTVGDRQVVQLRALNLDAWEIRPEAIRESATAQHYIDAGRLIDGDLIAVDQTSGNESTATLFFITSDGGAGRLRLRDQAHASADFSRPAMTGQNDLRPDNSMGRQFSSELLRPFEAKANQPR